MSLFEFIWYSNWACHFTLHNFSLLMKVKFVINDKSLIFGAIDYVYWSSIT